MTDKIKRAIAVLEVNKLISSSQTEFCESADLAIQALEKQIPKKPIDRCMFKECPDCHEIEIQYCNYCPTCGQKLDWSDEDDI